MSSHIVFIDPDDDGCRLEAHRWERDGETYIQFLIRDGGEPSGNFTLAPGDLPEFMRAVLPPDVLEAIDSLLTDALERAQSKVGAMLAGAEDEPEDELDEWEPEEETTSWPERWKQDQDYWRTTTTELRRERDFAQSEVRRLSEAFDASKALAAQLQAELTEAEQVVMERNRLSEKLDEIREVLGR